MKITVKLTFNVAIIILFLSSWDLRKSTNLWGLKSTDLGLWATTTICLIPHISFVKLTFQRQQDKDHGDLEALLSRFCHKWVCLQTSHCQVHLNMKNCMIFGIRKRDVKITNFQFTWSKLNTFFTGLSTTRKWRRWRRCGVTSCRSSHFYFIKINCHIISYDSI